MSTKELKSQISKLTWFRDFILFFGSDINTSPISSPV